MNLALNTVKRYARVAEPERLQRAPQYRPTLVDPYRDHLKRRRAAEPAVSVPRLFAEITALGYEAVSTCSTATSPKAASRATAHRSPHAASPGSY